MDGRRVGEGGRPATRASPKIAKAPEGEGECYFPPLVPHVVVVSASSGRSRHVRVLSAGCVGQAQQATQLLLLLVVLGVGGQ